MDIESAFRTAPPTPATIRSRGMVFPVDPARPLGRSVAALRLVRKGDVVREIAPSLLICDIEGAEDDLLPRMDPNGPRAAIVELHLQWIGPSGVNAVFGAFVKAARAYHARSSASKVVCFLRDWPLK